MKPLVPVRVIRLQVEPDARPSKATRPRVFDLQPVGPPDPGPDPGPEPGPGATIVLGASDTFRGGALVIASADGQAYLDTSRDTVNLSRWTLSNALRSESGVTLDTGSIAGSVASITSPDDYRHYDAVLDVQIDLPDVQTNGEVELASLEGDLGARVWLAKGFGKQNVVVARGAPDGSTVIAPALGEIISLRLVRAPRRVYGFVVTRTRSDPEHFVESISILDYPLPEPTAHNLTVRARNLAQAARIRTTVNNFTVRSAMDINGRLAPNKRTPNPSQITARVPAATIDEVGDATANAFGLFGTNPFDFTYTYGLGTPVGTEVVRVFQDYSDVFTVPRP